MISILKILKLVVNYNIKSKFWKDEHDFDEIIQKLP